MGAGYICSHTGITNTNSIDDIEFSSKEYVEGVRCASLGQSSDKAAFVSMLHMPDDSTPLRREDLFALDDFWKGYFDKSVKSLRGEIAEYKAYCSELQKENARLKIELNIYREVEK